MTQERALGSWGSLGSGTHTILYLHGFLSSPASSKVTALARGAADWNAAEGEARGIRFEVAAPDLNVPPRLVDEYLRALAATYPSERMTIVGSSLGGFYAGRLANITGAPVVLLNPCLNPWAFVQSETGEQTIFGTERRISVAEHFAEDFRSLADAVSPVPTALERTLAILSTADEVLDWRLAWQSLQGAGIVLSAGDDHRISRFAAFVPEILRFAAPNHAASESR